MSRTAMIAYINRRTRVYQLIIDALNGSPFIWSEGEGKHYDRLLDEIGLHLRSKGWLSRNGYRLKANAKPLGQRYYGAPISKHIDVYLVEVQAVKEETQS